MIYRVIRKGKFGWKLYRNKFRDQEIVLKFIKEMKMKDFFIVEVLND